MSGRPVAGLCCLIAFSTAMPNACSTARSRDVDTQRAAQPAPHDTSAAVTPQGYGAIRIGASAAQLGQALGSDIPASRSPDERECRYVTLPALPPGLHVMLAHDSVARIDITAPGPRTDASVGVGDSESRVLSAYGSRAVVHPNKYTGPVGHDIIVNAPADSTRRVIFETDGQKVLRFRTGRQPAVDLVEGCG